MSLHYVAILKGRAGELDALSRTNKSVAGKIMPLFEVPRLDLETIEKTQYLKKSSTPRITYLDRIAIKIADAWTNRPMMTDGYFWAADAITETGEQVVAYMVRKLETLGLPVTPVVGYDRWENQVYRAGIKGLTMANRKSYCLRLDSHAIEDSLEPDYFEESVDGILDEFEMLPSRCSVLIDFGDTTVTGIDELVTASKRIIKLLDGYGFSHFITAGCSIPKTIDLAVKTHDSNAVLTRRESLLWKTLRQELPSVPIVYGDYGVRGPKTNDGHPSKYTNGKIRHTTAQQSFVVRGHPFVNDHGYQQMHTLAAKVVKSPHFLGAGFSWGDQRIFECSEMKFLGSTANWIAIDTNHHIAFVVQEVEEFEMSTLAKVV